MPIGSSDFGEKFLVSNGGVLIVRPAPVQQDNQGLTLKKVAKVALAVLGVVAILVGLITGVTEVLGLVLLVGGAVSVLVAGGMHASDSLSATSGEELFEAVYYGEDDVIRVNGEKFLDCSE